MAIFEITPETSVTTTLDSDHAFDGDTAQADTLNIRPGASLTAMGLNARGALLGATGAWTVNVEGRIHSETSAGIELAGSDELATSSILIAAQGGVFSGVIGILAASNVAITNEGRIVGTSAGIAFDNDGDRTIINHGTITGEGYSIRDFMTWVGSPFVSNDRLLNTGTLNGTVDLSRGNDTVVNSGTINGFVTLGNNLFLVDTGTNRLTNTGFILENVSGGSGEDTVDNGGEIRGGVYLFDGPNAVQNTGQIREDVRGSSDSDHVFNTGAIGGGVGLGRGTNTLDNRGSIGRLSESSNSYLGLDDVDQVRNTGTMSGAISLGRGTDRLDNGGAIGGDVLGGDGNDVIVNRGTIAGIVDLGVDDDIYRGRGSNVDRVRDNDGSDNVRLDGGADTYFAAGGTGSDGTDTVDGGESIDMYDAGAAVNRLVINLDTVVHNQSPAFPPSAFNPGSGPSVARNMTTGATDNITGFEHARGGSARDVIFGSGVANVLDGGANNDNLFGYGANDTLIGGAGADMLFGGAGRDTLIGGTEADRFFYEAVTDSGLTNASRDVIMDFQDGIDSIDLRNIDTNPNNGIVNDPFAFIGTDVAFGNALGQLRARTVGDGWIVEGDVDGNRAADFSIKVFDPTHAITLTGADLAL